MSGWILFRRDGASHNVLSPSDGRGHSASFSASVSGRALVAMLAVAASSVAPPAFAAAREILVAMAESGVNGGAVTTVAGPGLPTLSASGVYGTFNYQVTASDFTGSEFDSTVSVTGTGQLNLFVTETGLTAGNMGASFLSGLTENLLAPEAGVTLTTFLDLNDHQFGLANQLAHQFFTANGAVTGSLTGDFTTPAYSLTAEYIITPLSGTSLSTISIVTDPPGGVGISLSIPETSTWAMMGVGFAGLALMGMNARRRRDPPVAV